MSATPTPAVPSRPAKLDEATRKALLSRQPSIPTMPTPVTTTPPPTQTTTTPSSSSSSNTTNAQQAAMNATDIILDHVSTAVEATRQSESKPTTNESVPSTTTQPINIQPPQANLSDHSPHSNSYSGISRGGQLVTPAPIGSYLTQADEDMDFSTNFTVGSNVRQVRLVSESIDEAALSRGSDADLSTDQVNEVENNQMNPSDSDSDSNSDSDGEEEEFFDFHAATSPQVQPLPISEEPQTQATATTASQVSIPVSSVTTAPAVAPPPVIRRNDKPNLTAFQTGGKSISSMSATANAETNAVNKNADFVAATQIASDKNSTDQVEVKLTVDQFVVPTNTTTDSSSPSTKIETDAPTSLTVQIPSTPTSTSAALSTGVVSPTAAASTQYLISKEICDTEQRFVDAMSTLNDAFIHPCQNATMTKDESIMGSIIFDTRVQVFFATASQILKLNSRFLQEIHHVLNEWSKNNISPVPAATTDTIGTVFLNYAPLFKIFSQYAKDHEIVSSLLITASQVKGSTFEKFVTRVQNDGRCRGQTMESLLIYPIQRIPRYKLLLEELKRKSKSDERGYAELLTSIEQIGDVAKHVNETIRHREQNEQLRLIEEKFVASSATGFKKLNLRDKEPPRKLIREGSLKRLTRKGHTTYYFHLFNDSLLYSEETVGASKQYKLHRRVDFYESVAITDKTGQTVQPPPKKENTLGVELAPAHPPIEAQIQYAIEVRSPAKSFIVIFPNAAEKDSWLKDLNQCIDAIRVEKCEDGSEFVAPVWTQDQQVKHCVLCTKEFTLFNRRHHCRLCGLCICALCSKSKRMLFSVDQKKPVRICDKCVRDQHEQGPISSKAAGSNGLAVGGGTGSNLSSPANKRASTINATGIAAYLQRTPTAPGTTANPSSSATTNGSIDLTNEFASDGTPLISESIIPPYRRALFKLARAYPGNERFHNVMELYLSEITYCKELEVLISEFVTPLLKQITTGKKSLLSNQPQTLLLGKNVSHNLLIFLNSFQPLYALAMELHKCLHAKIVTGEDSTSTSAAQSTATTPPGWNPQTTTFGELFLRYAHLFELYVNYSQNHKEALTILTENETFHKEIFLKYESRIKARMDEIHLEQRQMNEFARKKEAEWVLTEDHLKKSQTPTALVTETLDSFDEDDVDALRPTSTLQTPTSGVTSSGSRPSMARPSMARISISSQPIVLDEPHTHASLHDLLTSPFMRVSKYVWLLSSLLRATPDGHPDQLSTGPEPTQHLLAKALKAVQESFQNINSAILVGDNLAILAKLQEKFVGSSKEVDLIAPHRYLIKDGDLLRQTRKGATVYTFHLFNDVLLYSELTVQGKYKIHRRLPLITLSVVDPGGQGHQLEIHSPIKSFVVTANSDSEKEAWLEEITLAIKSEEKRVRHQTETFSPTSSATSTGLLKQRESVMMTSAPLWASDSTVEACPLCQRKFTFLNRRHHCRQCGILTCGPCSSHTRVIETLGKKDPVRICDRCHTGTNGQTAN